MLVRTKSFAQTLKLSAADERRVEALSQAAASAANGMTHLEDYRALGALCCHQKPKTIFEIGTFLGITSNFLLDVLPDARLVSIAYCRNRLNPFAPKYNNSTLPSDDVGSHVTDANRGRFRQLLGDSHALKPADMLREIGPLDLVFIDGDHSAKGVALDTELATAILSPGGGICWHDANPAEKYLDVRNYLERDCPYNTLATSDSHVGGVAYWHPSLADRNIVPASQSVRRSA